MKQEHKILDELKKQGGTGGFSVPDNYFDTFEQKMMDKIRAEEKPLAQKVIRVMKPWIWLAAIFIVVALVYYTTPYFMPKNNNTVFNEINKEVHFEVLATGFNEAELIEFIIEHGNSVLFENLKTDKTLTEGLRIEDIEDLVIFN